MQMERLTPEQLRRFLAKIDFDDGDDCWEWKASRNACGYGILGHNGKTWLAHKLMWHYIEGPVCSGKELDHLCRNRGCVRLSHLREVTHKENMKVGAKALKTHSPAGHPYSGENLWIDKHNGVRRCKVCMKAKQSAAHRRWLNAKTKG